MEAPRRIGFYSLSDESANTGRWTESTVFARLADSVELFFLNSIARGSNEAFLASTELCRSKSIERIVLRGYTVQYSTLARSCPMRRIRPRS